MTKQIVTSYKIIDGKFHLYSLDGMQVASHDAVWEGNFNCSHNQLTSLDGLQGCTFGGWFDCRDNQLTSLDGLHGCTFGGDFYCSGNQIPAGVNLPPTYQDVWEPFLAKGYVFADGMLTKLIHKRGDVYKTQKIGSDKIVYVIKDGDTFAHGKTVKAARLDLAFKKSDRDVEDYKNLPLDTRKEPEEWALIYRTITGACQEGTEMFMDGKGKLKKSYTLAEILAETAGAYNSEKFRQIVTGE